MSTARSLMVQRFKESVGISKGSYDETIAQSMTKLNSLDDKISKLSSMMLHTIEKLDKAAHAGQLAIMEAVCDLPVDLPGAAPAELESYRSITENLEKAMPERLASKFHDVVISHMTEWQAKIKETQDMFKVFSTARVKLDHYKEKVDSLQGKLMRKVDAKLNEQLSRNRDKLRSSQEEYDREREKFLLQLGETFENSMLHFEKLLVRLMQFEMTYHKEAHTIAAGFTVDVTSLQNRLKGSISDGTPAASVAAPAVDTKVTPSYSNDAATPQASSRPPTKSNPPSSTGSSGGGKPKRFSLATFLGRGGGGSTVDTDEPEPPPRSQVPPAPAPAPAPEPDNAWASNDESMFASATAKPVESSRPVVAAPAPAPAPAAPSGGFDPFGGQRQSTTFDPFTRPASAVSDPWATSAPAPAPASEYRPRGASGAKPSNTNPFQNDAFAGFAAPPPREAVVAGSDPWAQPAAPVASKAPTEFQKFTAHSVQPGQAPANPTPSGYFDPFNASAQQPATHDERNPFADMFS